MDSTQLERGTLESKDRDELTTIATALGGKPGSRARKAEIVDLILELSGGGNGSSSNGGRPPTVAAEPVAPAEIPRKKGCLELSRVNPTCKLNVLSVSNSLQLPSQLH